MKLGIQAERGIYRSRSSNTDCIHTACKPRWTRETPSTGRVSHDNHFYLWNQLNTADNWQGQPWSSSIITVVKHVSPLHNVHTKFYSTHILTVTFVRVDHRAPRAVITEAARPMRTMMTRVCLSKRAQLDGDHHDPASTSTSTSTTSAAATSSSATTFSSATSHPRVQIQPGPKSRGFGIEDEYQSIEFIDNNLLSIASNPICMSNQYHMNAQTFAMYS